MAKHDPAQIIDILKAEQREVLTFLGALYALEPEDQVSEAERSEYVEKARAFETVINVLKGEAKPVEVTHVILDELTGNPTHITGNQFMEAWPGDAEYTAKAKGEETIVVPSNGDTLPRSFRDLPSHTLPLDAEVKEWLAKKGMKTSPRGRASNAQRQMFLDDHHKKADRKAKKESMK